jgi:hypothetical protein
LSFFQGLVLFRVKPCLVFLPRLGSLSSRAHEGIRTHCCSWSTWADQGVRGAQMWILPKDFILDFSRLRKARALSRAVMHARLR